MEISIIGYSSLVKRKILFSLNKLKEIEQVNIFTRRHIDSKIFENFRFKVFIHPFENIYNYSKSCNSIFYYISTENSIHDELTYLLLSNFKNVLVDKPISLSLKSLYENINLARNNQCFLSEVITWEFHSQVNYLKEFINQNHITDVSIRFTIPLPLKDNFRVNQSLGSGVFWDMISYFVSTINFLNIEGVCKKSISKNLGKFCNQWMKINLNNEKINLNAIFGFGFPYQNKLEILSKSDYLIFNRIYTSDPSIPVLVNRVSTSDSKEIKFTDDSFMNYFKNVIDLINIGNHESELFNIKERYKKIFEI